MTTKTKEKSTPVIYDEAGNAVPTKYVRRINKLQHRNAHKYLKRAKKLNEQLKKFKEELLKTTDWLYEMMREDAHIYTGKKGNYTIMSFDKQVKIEVSKQDRIEFDEKINLAQEKLEQYISEKLEKLGAEDDGFKQVVRGAFETTRGKLDTKRVLDLFKYDINDKLWLEAMDLIKESMSRNFSKRYVRIFEKDEEGEYQAIDLNFSSL